MTVFKDLPLGSWFIWHDLLLLKKSTRTAYPIDMVYSYIYWGMNDTVEQISSQHAAKIINNRLNRIAGTPYKTLLKFAQDNDIKCD